MNLLQEAKPLTSYSSHSGLTSKMWILPDGRAVSFAVQHSQWALANRGRLLRLYRIGLARIQPPDDTAIRLAMLRAGAARVNYEHRGGKLACEANYRAWGPKQQRALKAVVEANARDISFVCIRLLNGRGCIVCERFVDLIEVADWSKAKKLQPVIELSASRGRR